MNRRLFIGTGTAALLGTKLAAAQSFEQSPILCWGDSLTQGSGVKDEEHESYPGVLFKLLLRWVEKRAFPGESSSQIVERLSRFPMVLAPDPVLALWVGKFDMSANETVKSVRTALAHRYIDRSKAIVLGPIPDADEDWRRRTSRIFRTNDQLRAEFPEQYLDIAGPLTEASGGTNGTLATSWTFDGRHLTAEGYAFVAGLVGGEIIHRGL